MAVILTNLNRRLKSPQDKAVMRNDFIDQGIIGPKGAVPNFRNQKNPFFGKFDENIRSDQFYQEFPDDSAEAARADYEFKAQYGGNTFRDPNIAERVDKFMTKYDPYFGDDTAGGRGLVESDRLVTQDSMAPMGLVVSSPAASGNGASDSNVAGKFPSNSVAV
tara:strand:- start:177 stop:665 length:489 start_codon:yes stop_codon:yes gene_type:complete